MKARHSLGFLGFLGFALVYAMRVNLSVAIVSMVNQTAVPHNDDNDTTDVCPDEGRINGTFVPVIIILFYYYYFIFLSRRHSDSECHQVSQIVKRCFHYYFFFSESRRICLGRQDAGHNTRLVFHWIRNDQRTRWSSSRKSRWQIGLRLGHILHFDIDRYKPVCRLLGPNTLFGSENCRRIH